MEENAQEASKAVDHTEKDVLTAVAVKDVAYTMLDQRLARFRSACQDYILHDFAAAVKDEVEARLWNAHSKVNGKFRIWLAQFREGDGRKKPVERRKAEKLYLEFIKSSMRFYRGYIQRLASNFGGIDEIVELARRFNLDTLSVNKLRPVDEMLKKQIVRSCYSSLVQLGDLSRYRETELQTKERNWGPARGYYDLASALDPTSGISNNQLAVIALADQDHLRAVYHLYRSICVENPAPQAQGNLKLEFRKIRKRYSEGKSKEDDVVKGRSRLQDDFLLFHARSWDGGDHVGDEDEQANVLRLLADELRVRPHEDTIRKFCLINIAAQDVAAKRASSDPALTRSFETFRRMNTATFITLLELLVEELEAIPSSGRATPSRASSDPFRLTPITRRMLPHLRLYSGWLLSNAQQLLQNETLQREMATLWRTYAYALSLLRQAFPVITKIPELPYLLDEDGDTLAFSPFSSLVDETRFRGADGRTKPVYGEATVGPRSVQNEMLYRVKCLVKDGLFLCKKEMVGPIPVPLVFAGGRFNFIAEDSTGQEIPLPDMENGSSCIDDEHAPQARGSGSPSHRQRTGPDAPGAMRSAMEDMVNSIVGTEPHASVGGASSLVTPMTPSVEHPLGSTANMMQPPATITALDLVQQLRRSSGALPQGLDLPGVWSSPFTPRPGEAPSSTSRPTTAHRTPRLGTPGPSLNSSERFRAQLELEKEAIQNRTSPVPSFEPSPSTDYEGQPQPAYWLRMNGPLHAQPQQSPWASSFPTYLSHETVISPRKPEPSPFGAVGEPRPRSNRTPTSGQAG
ncbi:hypothetical protein ABEF92_000487 [Exophiala dermatitidis]|uniref:EST1-like protein A n=1 Tax=Exophiala dermatitidis (strain ATCC 34100 / CBS 525.76 / NIH/UT8656) TaxID=858893 RepID=H6BYY6_EXODN|nr:EST1-like protein A [Exophiala dermatitidis NIH/UT8656]EHY56849.1 EST1-like protein A [Exophiala dermatitidis NIH/UT8656]